MRRLVLLSFFQAEAENKRLTAAAGAQSSRRVVYAIEEPETSQHPDSQEQIIRAFQELTEVGDQVLLTTHVPGLAGLVPVESLRYFHSNTTTSDVRVRKGSAEVYIEIADALGVLPDAVPKSGLKVAVLVEGKNDIDALRSMAKVIAAAGEVAAIDETKVFWTIGGGTALKDWVERKYLDKLGVHQIIIQDSDLSAAAIPLASNKKQWLEDIKANANVTAFLTKKRNMDNYVHIDVLGRMTGGKLTLPSGFDLDFVRIPDELAKSLTTERANGLKFYPDDHEGQKDHRNRQELL